MATTETSTEVSQLATVALALVLIVVLLPAVTLAALTDPWLSVAVGGILAAVAWFVPLGPAHRISRVLCAVFAVVAIVWGVVGLI